jgi:tRNA(adenine34) deaminase
MARKKATRTTRKKKKTATRKKRWSHKVTTDSTHPPSGTFTGSAESIARIMGSRKVSPKGIGSGIRMVQFFINRAGKSLSARRRRELERAKEILQARRKSRK